MYSFEFKKREINFFLKTWRNKNPKLIYGDNLEKYSRKKFM